MMHKLVLITLNWLFKTLGRYKVQVEQEGGWGGGRASGIGGEEEREGEELEGHEDQGAWLHC